MRRPIMCKKIREDEIIKHLETLFAFSVKRTATYSDAEDLTQDILVEIYRSLPSLKNKASFTAWMWKIAHHTYSHWVKKRQRDRFLYLENALDFEDSRYAPESATIRNDQLKRMRHEIALLSESYRKVIILYYLNGLNSTKIAQKTGIPQGTVVWRLHEARKSIRKGMEKMRNNGERSYSPGSLWVRMNGGIHGWNGWQPYTMFQRVLPQNIALAAYREPITLEELSVEMGIGRPYLEDEMNILVKWEAVKRVGGSTFQTDFIILFRDDMREMNKILEDFAEASATRIKDALSTQEQVIRDIEFCGSKLPWNYLLWFLVPKFVMEGLSAMKKDRNIKIKYPGRPTSNSEFFTTVEGGGSWFLNGIEGCPEEHPMMGGLNTSSDSDQESGNMLTGIFWNGKIGYRAGHLDLSQMKILRPFLDGKRDVNGMEPEEREVIARLIAKGYLKKTNGKVTSNVVGFLRPQFDRMNIELNRIACDFVNDLADLYEKISQQLERTVPPHLTNQIAQRSECICITVMWHIIDKLESRGILRTPKHLEIATEGIYFLADK